MTQAAYKFAEKWIGANVHSDPMIVNDDYDLEGAVAERREELLGAAKSAGFTDEDFAVFDLDEMISDGITNAYDAEAGFQD